MESASYEAYMQIIQTLKERHQVRMEMDHEFIHTFYESNIPLFQLIYAKKKDINVVFTSFHLDLNPVDAIMWFMRLRDIYPNTGLAECYYKDDYDETYMGQDAEIIKMYKTEQEILSANIDGYAQKKIAGRKKPDRTKFNSMDDALAEFHKMGKGDDDEYH